MTDIALKELLDFKYDFYNREQFILNDPIQIPHQFEKKEDIEIAAFLTATLSWGNRKAIIDASQRFMLLMDNDPFAFVMHADANDLKRLDAFYYRTFNSFDAHLFVSSLRNLYQNYGGLEPVFVDNFLINGDIKDSLAAFRNLFFEYDNTVRTTKHVASVQKGATCKRLNMFLRWMVRNDGRKVDFGLWKSIPTAALMLPLDLHTGNVSRKLGLLKRTQNDWRAVEEVTQVLRTFDSDDPIKYDFALFGMGVEGLFK